MSLSTFQLLRYSFNGSYGTDSLKLVNFDSAGMLPGFSASMQTTGNRFGQLKLKPVLNWAKCLFAEHTSDSSANYDSFVN